MGCSDVLKTCAEFALYIFNAVLFIGGIVVLSFGALMTVKVRGAKIHSLDSEPEGWVQNVISLCAICIHFGIDRLHNCNIIKTMLL